MFGFKSSTPEPALTPLPPRLSLRSTPTPPPPPSATSIFTETTPTPPARSASVPPSHRGPRESIVLDEQDAISEWGARGFAGLLSQDPRLSVDVCDAGDEDDALDHNARRGSMMALPGGGVAVAGPDAPLLIHEMHRVHLSAAQHRRRKLALWAGFITLLVLAATAWFVIEVIWSLITSGAQGRGVLRWAELASGFAALFSTVAVIPWLRTRRPNKLSLPTLSIAILTFALHLVLSIANIALVIIWRDELGTRCTWSVDAAWTMGRSGDHCDGNRWKGWIVAAALRAIVTVLVGFCWLTSLRAFYRCLRVTSIVDPSLAPSSEARAILARHSAGIVPLSAHSHSHTPHSDPNYLPHMPDRSAHYAFVSESNSYVPSEGRGGGGVGGGAGTWLGAKVLGAVGWLLGFDSYDVAKEQRDRDVEKGEKEAMLLREGRGSEGMPGQRLSGTVDPASMRVYAPLDMDNPEIRHVDNSARSSSYPSSSSPSSNNTDAQRYKGLFDGVTRPHRFRSNSQPTSPLLRPQSLATVDSSVRSTSPEPLDPSPDDHHLQQHEQLHQQYLADSAPPLPAPPPHSRTGSSGSTGGSLVYVRMSDGRLVRKLSTIASEASEATSARGGGSGEGGASRGTSASWATALEAEMVEEMQSEELEERGEIREVESEVGGWRRALGR
ncbi:hypothetical protein BCR35DRAFT_305803 [Leucosporidium creatinivorum]|uniref:Uncharacterized protein n=1 Tax=Leucosporidium creatinivorum TaxID=106004 RepID=A0A1Y2F0Q6_9BASI|nr:hypothetical protein BCR35DRAFT_305803 [Leucosporidium creatinivorum]